MLGACQYFLHGTTVGLNALLERKGAVVGLLATRGFTDVLEIRRGDRDALFDIYWKPPEPLVPRRLRLPVTERMLADGTVRTPLASEDIRQALAIFAREQVECVAIAFINAYANPAHEIAAAQALRAFGFQGEISLSHQVSGEYREYERTSTTVIDAYVRPRMAAYLQRLESQLRERGFNGQLLLTRSGGGAMSFAEAAARPYETIQSGPVAGAEGAAELARTLGIDRVVLADVGGTSFDTCLISHGRPQLMYEGMVVGMPVQTAWVDVRSIGAGGGSIAAVDLGKLLRVGPRSAGAVPGPAAYGRGGTEPTVTDAAVMLGMLGPGNLAGGIQLDESKARQALAPLGRELDLPLEVVAQGVITIVTANMANAIREITIEKGEDPRSAVLMAFGGAGPLFATLIARELAITRILIPPYPGNFSAWGLLGADITQTATRTKIVPLTDEGLLDARAILDSLFADLRDRAAATASHPPSRREVGLAMRYVGQEHTLTVAVDPDAGSWTPSAVRAAFTADYRRTFGHELDGDVEIVHLRVTQRTALPRWARERLTQGSERADRTVSEVQAYSFTRQNWLNFRVADRSTIQGGRTLDGPAILLEETATTYVDAGYTVTSDPSGSLWLTPTNEGAV
jgi:N-methylhydantoinase A